MTSPSDRTIQATNDDATSSKAHAVKRGYWKDAYMHYFCPIPVHKSPEINRGYFVRTQAFKAITLSFIKSTNGNCQIVNLGAGSDTLYFQLRDSGTVPRKFVEVDLEHNVHRKISIIRRHKLLGDIGQRSDEVMQDCLRYSQDGDVNLLPVGRLTDLDYVDGKVLLFDTCTNNVRRYFAFC
ncbi:[phosphatase 2A protein]-leucine-carboxy methyltransferase, partial [Paragonimus westermani]